MPREKTEPLAILRGAESPEGPTWELYLCKVLSLLRHKSAAAKGHSSLSGLEHGSRDQRTAAAELGECRVGGGGGGGELAGINNSFSGRPKQAAGVLCGLT